MQTTLVLLAKIALLVVLWLFILLVIRALRRDLSAANVGTVRPRRLRRTRRCRRTASTGRTWLPPRRRTDIPGSDLRPTDRNHTQPAGIPGSHHGTLLIVHPGPRR